MTLGVFSQKLARLMTNDRLPAPSFVGPQEAVVVSSTSTTVVVTIPAMSTTTTYGPAPYQPFPGASPATPPKGTKCIVGFVGDDVSQPYVLMFTTWP